MVDGRLKSRSIDEDFSFHDAKAEKIGECQWWKVLATGTKNGGLVVPLRNLNIGTLKFKSSNNLGQSIRPETSFWIKIICAIWRLSLKRVILNSNKNSEVRVVIGGKILCFLKESVRKIFVWLQYKYNTNNRYIFPKECSF